MRTPTALLTATCLAALMAAPAARAATEAELEARLESLAGEVAALRRELAALKGERALPGAAVAAAAPAPAGSVDLGATPAVGASADAPALTWFGYGELTYSRPRQDAAGAVADVGRFVLGAAYRFDERTRFVSELEVEHAVSSADDPGEVEVEQAYVERLLTDRLALKAGLVLMPVGLLNESHEPTRYHGVFRNLTETQIIPTTWREGGVFLDGTTEAGLRFNLGLTTGFDLTKWDPTSGDGLESPLGAIHQELAKARAADVALVGALNWRGTPGLVVGASAFTGNATQRQPGLPSGRVTLWEGHARWTPGPFEFSALYARGTIGDTARLNAPLVGNPVLIPASFDGGYLEAAVRAVERPGYALTPFVRLERINTARSYAAIAPGLTPGALPTETAWTGGVDFTLGTGVVFKADYQGFRRDRSRDRFALGVGYAF
jgi:hypothetical protein